MKQVSFQSEVWIYPSETAAWYFVNVPKKLSAEIEKKYVGMARGWGSLPVEVTVGHTLWPTSIFPDKRSESYLLPLKADVRRKEGIQKGQTIRVKLTITAH